MTRIVIIHKHNSRNHPPIEQVKFMESGARYIFISLPVITQDVTSHKKTRGYLYSRD